MEEKSNTETMFEGEKFLFERIAIECSRNRIFTTESESRVEFVQKKIPK